MAPSIYSLAAGGIRPSEEAVIHKPQRSLRRFLRYVWPYWPMLAGGAACGMMKFILPAISALALKFLTDRLTGAHAGTSHSKVVVRLLDNYLNWVSGILPASWNVTSEWGKFQIFMFSALGIYAVWAIAFYFRSYLSQLAGHRVILDLRTDLYQHITRQSHSFFQNRQSGGIVSRLMADIALAQNFVGNAMTNIWMDLASCLFFFAVLFATDVPLALASMIVFPFYIASMKTLGRKSKRATRDVQEALEEFSGDVQERVAGIHVVKSFAQERREVRTFFGGARRLFDLTMRNVRLSALANALTQWLTQMATLGLIWYGGYRLVHGYITAGDVVMFIILLQQVYMPINRISEMNTVMHNSLAAIDRVFEVFDIQPDVREADRPVKLERINGRITFSNVSFAYPASDPPRPIEERPGGRRERQQNRKAGVRQRRGKPQLELVHPAEVAEVVEAAEAPELKKDAPPDWVLQDINLDIRPGEVVALVGPSGAGKSTMVQLVPRFYDPQIGTISIDGHDLKELQLRALRSQIGVVSQDIILFSGTARDNLLYGRPDATEQELVAAAEAAYAHEFLSALPEGYDTLLGERGAKLSGGQKQRLAIARAFLCDPRILILDEATSALDSESEQLIQNALQRLMQHRTNIVIAHRLSTILNADRIITMQNGRILDIGPHEELLARGGLYARLYHTQFRTALAS